MNFFGHAAVADLTGVGPGAALGSMLPDFAGMLGLRLMGVQDTDVARGVALHHATDEVFHRAPAFVALCADAVAELESRQLDRGSARAVAHVGTELLLDGWLVGQGLGTEAYMAGLAAAGDDGLDGRVLWRDPQGSTRLAWLVRRLRHFGLPHAYADPGFVTERLERALHPRPRLRLAPERLPDVHAWVGDWQPRVHACAAELLHHVHRGVASHPNADA
jgi:hypothetical protein